MQKVTVIIECEDNTPIIFNTDETKRTAEAQTAEQILTMDAATRQEPVKQITKEQQKRYDIASDLANVCEYLEEAEIMKLQIIIQECKRRANR